MNLSYWETKTWLSGIDFSIIGSGITGLNCALNLKKRFPKAKIIILEQGILPGGASTKNAGFTCFGSVSEILDDLKSHSEEEVLELVRRRVDGLALLRATLGDKNLGYQSFGGYEVFTRRDKELFEDAVSHLEKLNALLKPVFGDNIFSLTGNDFGFQNVQEKLIFNKYEGQLDAGKMMSALLQKVHIAGIKILNNVRVEEFIEKNTSVEVKTNQFQFPTKKLFIATNGFSSKLGILEVKPGRGQVLITKPIPGLNIKGSFHLDKGYYYFRNVEDRILLGGGRNLDFEAEQTTQMLETPLIQNKLEELLRSIILPGTAVEIDKRWSGIMGVGAGKQPIIEQRSEHVYCGVKLGGMGVAIGSLVGKELAELL